jgi:TetR/AcrR family transcriptional repressor of nem operon
MTTGLRRQIERLSRIAAGEDAAQKRQDAIGSWAAMVGAMILARVSDDPALSGEVLDQTRAWLAARAADSAKARYRPASAKPRTPPADHGKAAGTTNGKINGP